MRRFLCVAGLLFGLSGDRYVWAARSRAVVPVVQPVALNDASGIVRSAAWWLI